MDNKKQKRDCCWIGDKCDKHEGVERGRIEIIFELAHYAHQSWYKKILGWETEYLRALLEYYESPEVVEHKSQVEMQALRALKNGQVVIYGLDTAREGDDHSVIFEWPIGYKVADEKSKMPTI